jgi:hypothetical protein
MSSSTTTFSASAYRKAGQTAAAKLAATRNAEWEARKSEQAAKQNQIRQRVLELATMMFHQLPAPEEIEKLPMLHGSTLITSVRPPSKEEADVEIDGVVQSARVPKYPATETHFAGYNPETRVCVNPEEGGLPMVALLQGFRSKDADGRLGKSDPKTLPDGLTAVDRLNAMLIQMLPEDESPENSPCVRLHWNARPRGADGAQEDGRLEVRLVWDIAAWDSWGAKRAEKQRQGGRDGAGREAGRGDGRGDGRQLTLDEHMARQKATRTRAPAGAAAGAGAAAAVKDGETFTMVRGRRRAGRGGE